MAHLIEDFHIAVPTAFYDDESLNIEATLQHVINLSKKGINSVLVSGSTGEQHSLSNQEKFNLIEVFERTTELPEDFELIFGIANIRQKKAEELAQAVKDKKMIKAILIGFPPYLLPSQIEALSYCQKIIKLANKPAIIYNNPNRTGFDLENETLMELIKDSRVIGIKEAGKPSKIKKLLQMLPEEQKDFYIYAGGENDIPQKIDLGFNRISSIWGNLYPNEIQNWFLSNLKGNKVQLPTDIQTIMASDYSSLLPFIKDKIFENEKIEMGICRTPVGND